MGHKKENFEDLSKLKQSLNEENNYLILFILIENDCKQVKEQKNKASFTEDVEF